MKTWKVCQGFMHSLQTAQSQAVDVVGVINSQQEESTHQTVSGDFEAELQELSNKTSTEFINIP